MYIVFFRHNAFVDLIDYSLVKTTYMHWETKIFVWLTLLQYFIVLAWKWTRYVSEVCLY